MSSSADLEDSAARDGGSYNIRPSRAARRLQFQLLRKTRKNFTATLCDDHDILLTHAAESRVIQTRLNREYLSIFQRHFLQPRMLMNLQPESVTGAVKKSDLPALTNTS